MQGKSGDAMDLFMVYIRARWAVHVAADFVILTCVYIMKP